MLVPESSAFEAPPSYFERQRAIGAQATGLAAKPATIDYLDEEHETWRNAMRLLDPVWERHVALPIRSARYALQLPADEIPQLSLVSERLQDLTGFRFASVPATVGRREFFGALAHRVFPSTQFIRWSGSPLYTPAPDVLHELGGHAISLANKHLAELHHLAGRAALATNDDTLLRSIAAVFWYTAEFGVVASRTGWKAYGAGLLSSPGELSWFPAHAEVRPIDIAQMIRTQYDIDHYQPVLFGADSLEHVLEVAGRFFTDIIDHVECRGDGEPIIDLRDTLTLL